MKKTIYCLGIACAFAEGGVCAMKRTLSAVVDSREPTAKHVRVSKEDLNDKELAEILLSLKERRIPNSGGKVHDKRREVSHLKLNPEEVRKAHENAARIGIKLDFERHAVFIGREILTEGVIKYGIIEYLCLHGEADVESLSQYIYDVNNKCCFVRDYVRRIRNTLNERFSGVGVDIESTLDETSAEVSYKIVKKTYILSEEAPRWRHPKLKPEELCKAQENAAKLGIKLDFESYTVFVGNEVLARGKVGYGIVEYLCLCGEAAVNDISIYVYNVSDKRHLINTRICSIRNTLKSQFHNARLDIERVSEGGGQNTSKILAYKIVRQ